MAWPRRTHVYLSASDWSAPWHLPQEVAAGLARQGDRVLYVESLGWRRPRLFDLPRVAGRLTRAVRGHVSRRGTGAAATPAGLEVLSPVLIPGARSGPATRVNRLLLLRLVHGRLGPRTGPLVLWVFTPSRLAVDAIDAIGADLTVYYCIQSHAHRPLAPPDIARREEEVMARADAVVTDGVLLHRERVGRHPHVYRVPGGVDIAAHTEETRPPAWAGRLPRPVVGYLGTIDHRVDVGLIASVARARPDWSVVVVGPVVDQSVAALAALPNVTLPGAVPIDEVPAALAAFDVGIMAYADRPMTPYTYPAKLHQYLASGLPIVSTPLPDLEEFADVVETASGSAAFVAAVERALATPPDVAARRRVASRHTWGHRMAALEALVAGHLAGDPPPSDPDPRA